MTTANKTAVRIKVTINNADIFDAWSLKEEWNGWAVPYFEKQEADRAAKLHACKYDVGKDAYISERDGRVEKFFGTVIETPEGSKKAYSIGGGSWIWDKTYDESERTEDANGLEIQEGDALIAAENIEFGYVDGGRTPKVVYKKGEIVFAEELFWDESAQSGQVVIGGQEFDGCLFIKEVSNKQPLEAEPAAK